MTKDETYRVAMNAADLIMRDRTKSIAGLCRAVQLTRQAFYNYYKDSKKDRSVMTRQRALAIARYCKVDLETLMDGNLSPPARDTGKGEAMLEKCLALLEEHNVQDQHEKAGFILVLMREAEEGKVTSDNVIVSALTGNGH